MFEMTIRAAGRDVRIQTHDAPHVDEAAAVLLLQEFADQAFLDRFAPDGTLQIALPGCYFDEHPKDGQPRKEGKCAATLVADELTLPKSPSGGRILNYVFRDDNGGSGDQTNIGAVMKKLFRVHQHDPERVMRWAMQGLSAKMRQKSCSRDFRVDAVREAVCEADGKDAATCWHAETRRASNAGRAWYHVAREEARNISTADVRLPNGRTVTIATMETDNPQLHTIALRDGAAVAIKRGSGGNVQIFSNQRMPLKLAGVARLLSIAEQFVRGDLDESGNPKVLDDAVLTAEGNSTGYWYYFPAKTEFILNGSHTFQDVPATALPLSFIRMAVAEGLKPLRMHPSVHAIRNTVAAELKLAVKPQQR
mgnify:CR=1 FL=1